MKFEKSPDSERLGSESERPAHMRVDDGPPPSTVEPPGSKAPESEVVHSSGSDHTIRTAAAFLGVDPNTLRKQCSEAARGGRVADLGGGIFAFKVGRFWRVRFPWWE